MAYTEKGTYYPDNYDEMGDVPADMKKMAESIDAGLSGKVDKVDGKDLSTNDFTNAYKNKLDGLSNYDDSGIKQDIAKQNDLISSLKDNQINLTAEGTSINVKDASDLPAVIEVSGGVRQNGEPTPDSPVEVETVGDNVNLYPYEKILFSSSRSTIAWCYINGLDTAYGTDVLDKTEYKITLKPGTYNINLKSDDKNLVNFQLVTKGDTAEKIISTDNSSFILNDETTLTLRYRVNNPSLGLKIDSIKIEPGSVATSYSAYGIGSVEINKVNKNWFNGYWELGAIDVNTGNDIVASTEIKSDFIKILPLNFYAVSRLTLDNGKFRFYDIDKNYLGSKTEDNKPFGSNKEVIFTTPKDAYYIRFNIGITDLKYQLQFELSNKATDYVSHESEIYNLPIQQPMLSGDTFVKEDGNWFEVHGWKKIILNGTENWTYKEQSSYSINYFTVNYLLNDYMYIDDNTVNYYCNMYKSIKVSERYREKTFFINNIGAPVISTNDFQSAEEFKEFLSQKNTEGNPVYVWYQTTTSTKIPCTPEQVEVLEQLYNNETYRPVTNIFTQEDLANLKLNYVADTKLYIDNKFNTLAEQILNQ